MGVQRACVTLSVCNACWECACSVCGVCVSHVPCVSSGCAMDVQWMCNGCAMGVQGTECMQCVVEVWGDVCHVCHTCHVRSGCAMGV